MSEGRKTYLEPQVVHTIRKMLYTVWETGRVGDRLVGSALAGSRMPAW